MSATPDPTHGHTAPEPEAEIPAGVGTQLAGWAIDAMDGHPASPDGLDDDDARRLRRVNDAIAALHDAAADGSIDERTDESTDATP